MCDREATSQEHVPPRCLFPEKKYLPAGADLRKQLITVPACDEHNNAKSEDDEYLLYLLVINLPANKVAKDHFLSKILRRAIKKNPRIINQIMDTKIPIVVVDEVGREKINSVAIRVEDKKLNSSLDHISRALYFHHFGEKWAGSVKTHPDFLLPTMESRNGQQLNELSTLMAQAADQIFLSCQAFGTNPDVFMYQVHEDGDSVNKLMRLHFYEGCRVSVFFGVDG